MGKTVSVSEEKLLYFSDKILGLTSQKKFSRFDGFIPFVPELYPDDEFVFVDAKPSDLSSTVNISIYTPGNPDGISNASKAGQIKMLKAISTKELRKRTGHFFVNPYVYEVCFDDYPKIADAFLQYTKNGMRYVEIGGFKTSPEIKAHTLDTAQILMGAQFNIENMSHVYLRPEGSAFGFRYPIHDLSQLKELFSLRDIPEGYKRKAALKHWVASHLRRKPSKPDEQIEIKKYLRGKESFDWFGIRGTVYVND